MSNFYIVGAYEDFKIDIFPSHISPIIAEHDGGRYRRWTYNIESPYKIIPTHPVGNFYDTTQEMFPYMTYSLFSPVELKEDSQVIAISKNKVIAGSNRFFLCARISIAAVKNIKDLGFLQRSFLSIKNCLN